MQRKVQPVSMIVKAEGPSGSAKIHSDEPKHALGLVQYLRTVSYKAWIEDRNGNEIEEAALKKRLTSAGGAVISTAPSNSRRQGEY
jgi:hypothetical protein